MRILVDMDGILVDMLGAWLAAYNADVTGSGPRVTKAQITTWNVHDHLGIGHGCYQYLDTPGFWDELQPLPGAIEGYKALREFADVRVCSSPHNANSARAKIEWCERWLGISRKEIILTHDKIEQDGDVLIDDKPDHLRAWGERGRFPIGICYPYNAMQLYPPQVYLAYDYRNTEAAWTEIVALCKRAAK